MPPACLAAAVAAAEVPCLPGPSPTLLAQGAIYDYFDQQHPGTFTKFDGLAPVVSAKAVSTQCGPAGWLCCATAQRQRLEQATWRCCTLKCGGCISASPPPHPPQQNFDDILIPTDHVSRSPNDTYYVDTDTVLR